MRNAAAALLLLVTSAVAGADERPAPAGPASAADRQAAWERHQQLAQGSLFRGLAWRSVGPVIQGGRVVDIENVPGEPFTFYVAYASGGLWLTKNNGDTFEPIFDRQPTIIMGDIALDPSNPKRIWVGTGENNSSRSSYGGHGVFLSEDGGRTWQSKGLLESDRIGRVLVDPRDSKRVYVAALGKLYTPGGQRGVYRTTDGGQTWKQVLPGTDWTGAIDMVMDPRQPDTLYAATWDRQRRPWDFVESGEGSAIWKSTDGGDTWKRLSQGLPTGEHVGRIGLAICRDQPNTLYASIDNQALLPEDQQDLGAQPLSAKRVRKMSKEEFLEHDPDDIEGFVRELGFDVDFSGKQLIEMLEKNEISLQALLDKMGDANAQLFQTDIRGLEIYRSDDAGATWRRTHEEPLRRVVHTYGYYFGRVYVAPDDPERVYTMGVPLITSTDGGKTWHSIHGPKNHVDYHVLWINPEHSQHILAGNDGGLDLTYDHGKTWRSIDAQAVAQFYTVAVDMKKPYRIYGGTQDNGTLMGSSRSRPGRDEWSFVGGGDGMYVNIDPRDGTVYYGFQFGFYSRKDPNGSRKPVRPKHGLEDEPLRYNWCTPVRLSPHNPDIVWFGTNMLHRSMDKGETWKAVSADLTTSKNRGDVPFGTLTTVSESPKHFGLVWVGTDDGHVHVTTDGGLNWREVTAGIPSDRWVTRVEASHHEKTRAYLSLSGYRDDDIASYVFVTEDLGTTWTSIAGGLPAEPVNVIREDPVNPDVLYVGTDRSAYASIDRGKTWHALTTDLPSVPVHDLVVHPRDRELVAGTHGRSMYVLDALPIQEMTAENQARPVIVFPLEELKASRGWRNRRRLWGFRPEDAPKRKIPFWSSKSGTARLEIRDDKDRVLRVIEMDAPRGVSTFTWDLLLDEKLALEAEAARLAAKQAEKKDDDAKSNKGQRAKRPWAEARRLGYPLYITGGTYTVAVQVGDEEATTKLKVKAPKPRKARKKKKPPLRGRDDDD